MLLLRHYKTQLLGHSDAFWRYFRGRLIVRSASRGFFTNITRARMMCAGARVRVHVRVCVHKTPSLKKEATPKKRPLPFLRKVNVFTHELSESVKEIGSG